MSRNQSGKFAQNFIILHLSLINKGIMSNFPANINRHFDALDFHSDGGLFISASSLTNRYWTGSIWYFDQPELAPDVERCSAGVEVDSGVGEIAWLPGSERVVGGTDSGAVMLWELTDERHSLTCVSPMLGHNDVVTTVSYMTDGKLLSGSNDRRLKVWDTTEFVAVATYLAHSKPVHCVRGHPTNPNILVSTGMDGRLLFWDLRETKPVSLIETSFLPSPATTVAWQPDAEHGIILGTETGELVAQDTRWSVGTPVVVKVHNRPVTHLKFAPHRSRWVASSSEDCTVCVTDVSSKSLICRDKSHEDMVRGLAWEAKSQQLLSCGWDSKISRHTVTETESLSLDTMAIKESVSPKTCQMDTEPSVVQCNGTADTSAMKDAKPQQLPV